MPDDYARTTSNPDIRYGRLSGNAMMDTDSPIFLSALYEEMADRWTMARDLMVGTEAIRARSETYIPRHSAEEDAEYEHRAGRAECFPGLQHSIKGLTGIAFRKDPILQEDISAEFRVHAENIDGTGNHLAIFAREVFEDALTVGHSLVLVDFPRAPDGEVLLRDQVALGLRPYWTHIRAEQVYSWRTAVVNGVLTLTQIVIHEEVTTPVGRFGTATIDRYRVFFYDIDNNSVSYEIWEASDNNEPEVVEAGPMISVSRIPIIVVYGGARLGPLFSLPPLIDLAHANISHIQVLADHRYALHLASVPILVFKGRPINQQVEDDGTPKKQTIGPNVAIDVGETGDVKYVEHSGSALGQTRTELKDLETRMATLGLAMLQHETRAAETAEAKRIDKSEKDSTLATIVRSMQDGMEIAVGFHEEFLGKPPASGGSIFMDMDFDAVPFTATDITTYSGMVVAGQLSLETMWNILRDRGALPDDFDPDAERERIEMSLPVATEPEPPDTPADESNPNGDA